MLRLNGFSWFAFGGEAKLLPRQQYLLFCVRFSFETEFHLVFKNGLEFYCVTQPGLEFVYFSCLSLLSVGILFMCHHTQLSNQKSKILVSSHTHTHPSGQILGY